MKRIVFLLVTIILVSGCGSKNKGLQETHGLIRVERSKGIMAEIFRRYFILAVFTLVAFGVSSANKTIFAYGGTTFGPVYDDDDGPINGKEREVDIDIQGNVNISSVGQFGTVETSGSIRIGDEDVVCDSNNTGKIRFTGTDFEGFDGNNWASFSSPVPGVVYYAIGDKGPAGGIVFYVTDSGLSGLEAAPADQSSGAEWGCYATAVTGADGTAVGTGKQNTADILAECSTAGIAARIADDYTLGGYDDWFLPSKDELNLLYQQKDVVGGFTNDTYWSSTEHYNYDAWCHLFKSGLQYYYVRHTTRRVRAVRAF